MTKTAAVTVTIVILLGATIAVKFSSRVKDSYFNPTTGSLRLVPTNLRVIRQTKFPNSAAMICEIHNANSEAVARAVGQNVRLRDIIGEAWDCNPARVVLPPEAPNGRFDFLVTMGADARENLKTAVRKKLGYVAHPETRDTQVWVLKVENSASPGLSVSSDAEKGGAAVKDGKLYLKHQRLSVIMAGLSLGLNCPVVDKTGLDKFYNFSVPWTPEVQKRMQNGAFDPEGVKKIFADLGIALEPDTEPQEMYVVEKAR